MKIVTLVVMLMNRDLTDFESTYWSLVPENHDLCLWVLGSWRIRGFFQYYEAADSEPASTVPHRESRILRPLVFRTQCLLLFKRSNNTRTQSTAHYPNAIKKGCNITSSNKLSNKYLCSLLNACVKKTKNKKKKQLLLMEGIQLADW